MFTSYLGAEFVKDMKLYIFRCGKMRKNFQSRFIIFVISTNWI